MVSILSTCRKRSQMHKPIQPLNSFLSPLQIFHQRPKPRVRAYFHKIGDTADFELAAVSPSATPSPISQGDTNGLSLLTGSVILAMICAIFAGVVLAVFLFYRRRILHYGREKVDKSVEKERQMSLVLTLQPSESRPILQPNIDANKTPVMFASVFVIGITTVSVSTPRINYDLYRMLQTALSTWICIATFANDSSISPFNKNVTILLAYV